MEGEKRARLEIRKAPLPTFPPGLLPQQKGCWSKDFVDNRRQSAEQALRACLRQKHKPLSEALNETLELFLQPYKFQPLYENSQTMI